MKLSVLLLDGDSEHTLQIASELHSDLNVEIHAVGTTVRSRVLRSRYCDHPIVLGANRTPDFASDLLELIHQIEPDVVLPVTFHSVLAVNSIRGQMPGATKCALPPQRALQVAMSKSETMLAAHHVGVRVPQDYTTDYLNGAAPESFPYPLFLKIGHEVGGNITALVRRPNDLHRQYEELASQGEGDDILVQEFIAGDSYTYGCALLYLEGKPVLSFQHQELRSIPRSGGSGTRVRQFDDSALTEQSERLLNSLEWEGPALVEFKINDAGEYVLMEINPKYWASYALASQNGARFASETVARLCGIEISRVSNKKLKREMVFPLREFAYVFNHLPEESWLTSIKAMVFPPASPNILWRDVMSYVDSRWITRVLRIVKGK